MKILLIALIIIIVVFVQYNILIKLKMNTNRSKSVIDVYLKQRFDLIPNLVKVVKGYMNHEKETLENVTKLRNAYDKNGDIKISQELNDEINKIISVAENYSDLKADKQFLNIQKNLTKIESQLQAARRLYNNDVTRYNTRITIFPLNIIARIFGFKEEQLFYIKDEDKKIRKGPKL
ncbi:MAG: LemA family protein [Bacilli bacterium]|nr:LemA family protein [Bacilli bacterium]